MNPVLRGRPMQIHASLHEIALECPDPQATAAFYSSALGYRFERDHIGLLGVANQRRLRLSAGPPRRLGYATYAVPDETELAALEARLNRARVPCERIEHPGVAAGALCFTDPDGNKYMFGLPLPREPAASDDTYRRPARLQHVVFATTDLHRLVDFHIEVTGFALSDVVAKPDGSVTTAFLRCSNEHHSLAVFAAPENRLDHHCLEAGDWGLIRDWADHLGTLHIPLKWGPGRHGPGNNLFIFIHDPVGNWVEISAELEHVSPERAVGSWPHEERTLNSWGIGFLRDR